MAKQENSAVDALQLYAAACSTDSLPATTITRPIRWS